MTTLKNGRLIYVHRWSLGSRERAENQPITNKCAETQPITKECAENYHPITNVWSVGTRRCAEHYFVETIFAENNAVVVVRQHTARTSVFSPHLPGSPLDLLTIFKSNFKNKTLIFMGYRLKTYPSDGSTCSLT